MYIIFNRKMIISYVAGEVLRIWTVLKNFELKVISYCMYDLSAAECSYLQNTKIDLNFVDIL